MSKQPIAAWCSYWFMFIVLRGEAVRLRRVRYAIHSALPPGQTQESAQRREAVPVRSLPSGRLQSACGRSSCCRGACVQFCFSLFPLFPPKKNTRALLSLQNFSRTDRLLRHRRLCTVGVTKEESQFSQDTSAHPASWSPLQPSNNRLTVWHRAELHHSLTHSSIS